MGLFGSIGHALGGAAKGIFHATPIGMAAGALTGHAPKIGTLAGNALGGPIGGAIGGGLQGLMARFGKHPAPGLGPVPAPSPIAPPAQTDGTLPMPVKTGLPMAGGLGAAPTSSSLIERLRAMGPDAGF